MKMSNVADKITVLRLDEIEVNPKWNVRSNLDESQRGPDESGGFESFVKGLFVDGQDTPAIVKPNKAGAKKPYYLVSGNRRFEALSRIAATGKDPAWGTGFCKAPTIKAIIRDLTDTQALEVNLRENTEREDLGGADLAYGVGRLCAAYRKDGIKYTQTTIADKVGFSQAYTGKLMKIVGEGRYGEGGGAKQEIFEHWRVSPARLTIDEMHKVASLPLADQQKAYDELSRGSDEKGGKGQGDPLKAAAKQAANVGKMLGTLVGHGALDVDLDDEWWAENITLLVKIKNRVGKKGGTKEPSPSQIAKVGKAASKAYADTLVAIETEADGEADMGTGKSGKQAKRGSAHADN